MLRNCYMLKGSVLFDLGEYKKALRGDKRILEVVHVPIFDVEGQLDSIEGIARDVSRAKAAEESYAAARSYSP